MSRIGVPESADPVSWAGFQYLSLRKPVKPGQARAGSFNPP